MNKDRLPSGSVLSSQQRKHNDSKGYLRSGAADVRIHSIGGLRCGILW